MEEQVFNKEGKIYKYLNLDEISKLNIPDYVRAEFKAKFNKKVFFDCNGSCKIGKLVGIEINEKLSAQYYIIDTEDKKIYVPCSNSLTLL